MTNRSMWLSTGAGAAMAVIASVAFAADDGRLLASNCFQCHGTAGTGGAFDELAGDSKKDILEKLSDMRSKNPRRNIMFAHARGYTQQQLDTLASYFAALPKR